MRGGKGGSGGTAGYERETFATHLGFLATVVGTAIGLGNVWRFPYMVGRYGGGAFVLLYLAWVVLVGIPALVAEWSLGRRTRRGPVGAFAVAGLPGGRFLGWLLFGTVSAATAYYVNAVGWVLYHGLGEAVAGLGGGFDAGAVLPPDTGFDATSFALQGACTLAVVAGCGAVLLRGVRRGIERASSVLTPILFLGLLALVVRSLTLPGRDEGLAWLFAFEPGAVKGAVAIAALSQVVFSLALGGTFMVVYGSYLERRESVKSAAAWTAAGDTLAGLLAGLAIFPAVFAFGLEPSSGPGLIFATLPGVFEAMPGGRALGALFFLSLAGAAWLSAVAAFEVLVAGLTDHTRLDRRPATFTVVALVLTLSVPPMLNMRIFVPWDLAFGSGMQTLGALLAALTAGWALKRGALLAEIAGDAPRPTDRALVAWIRWVVPGAVLAVGVWWFLGDVLGVVGGP